jgi:hypothetical protein
MTKTFLNFYKNAHKTSSLEKKLLIQNVYSKYLIYQKKDILNNIELNFENFVEFQKSNLLPKAYLNKVDLSGYSINLTSYKFRSQLNKACVFNMPFYSNKENKNVTLNLVGDKFLIKNYIFLLLIKVVKGGFKAYSNKSLIGFLPGSQYKGCIRQNRKFFKLLRIKNLLTKKIYILQWIPFKISKIKTQEFRSFSKRKKLKKKRYFNMVFMHKNFKNI